MKHFFTSCLLLIFFITTFGQSNFAGEYKLYTTGDTADISGSTILKLNCNNTFIQHDSIATGYGKWNIKNKNRLVMQFDSIAENNRMDIIKTKIVYLIEDGRIFRKKIPKKEYTESKKSMESYLPGWQSESFTTYKEKALKMYYRKAAKYSCE
jgi:hypothetical protein